ncbi:MULTISPECIES: GNAT family N-acetyltransferase [Rossellomorea]|uniref:GNAT family N-acetyltransferase n=1 Tax=Rossellomorea TaxID=2837508 RepID=UPI00249423D6|nr:MULTISPECIES: GNAT family N-acetyltransferase [Rossellomorea]MDT9024167.1 GNAT family N-acetyltransferase [Rossellomorea sp. YC4-1]
MSRITIEKATIQDAEALTDIKRKVFDAEKEKWLSYAEDVVDYNIQPPGYDSIEMGKYMIHELNYFKILYQEVLVGGVIVTLEGKRHGRVDRIFVDSDYQGKGIGSAAIRLVEEKFPQVKSWELETSSRQLNNHAFYEKLGYKKVFESEDEFCYEKRLQPGATEEVETKEIHIQGDTLRQFDLSRLQVEQSNMTETDFYGINGSHSTFSNSNLKGARFSNCNLSESRFQNINLKKSLIADLNLSHSEFAHVTFGGTYFHDTTLGEEGEPIIFERCDLKGCQFKSSNLNDVRLIDCETEGMRINNILVKDLLDAYEIIHKKR